MLNEHSRIDAWVQFWCTVDMSGGPDACWPWRGKRNEARGDRGRTSQGPRPGEMYAHRAAYEYATGRDPGDMLVCHHCDNPPCCNPAHLFLGTNADNMADMIAKGRHARGEKLPNARVTAAEVADIRRRYANGERDRWLAAEFGMSYANMRRILLRQTWRHVP